MRLPGFHDGGTDAVQLTGVIYDSTIAGFDLILHVLGMRDSYRGDEQMLNRPFDSRLDTLADRMRLIATAIQR